MGRVNSPSALVGSDCWRELQGHANNNFHQPSDLGPGFTVIALYLPLILNCNAFLILTSCTFFFLILLEIHFIS